MLITITSKLFAVHIRKRVPRSSQVLCSSRQRRRHGGRADVCAARDDVDAGRRRAGRRGRLRGRGGAAATRAARHGAALRGAPAGRRAGAAGRLRVLDRDRARAAAAAARRRRRRQR